MLYNNTYKVQMENVWEGHLFDMITTIVGSDGGDGCGIVVADSYEELANDFDEWRKDKIGWKSFYEDITSNGILFSDHSNENILFCKSYESPVFNEYIFRVQKD